MYVKFCHDLLHIKKALGIENGNNNNNNVVALWDPSRVQDKCALCNKTTVFASNRDSDVTSYTVYLGQPLVTC